jgi:hypothetical protein
MVINLIFAIIVYLVIRYQNQLKNQFSENMGIIGINGLRIAQGKVCEEIANDYNNPFFILQSHFYLAKRQTENLIHSAISDEDSKDFKTIFNGIENNLENLRKKIATLTYLSVTESKHHIKFYRDRERFVTLLFWLRSMIIDSHPLLEVLISDIPSTVIYGPSEIIVRGLAELVFDQLESIKDPRQVLISVRKEKNEYLLSIRTTGSEIIKDRSKNSSSFLMVESIFVRGLGWIIEEVQKNENQNYRTFLVRIKNKRFH